MSKHFIRNTMLCIQFFICWIFVTLAVSLYLQTEKTTSTLFGTLSKEEKEKLSHLSPEERAAYRATGTYLYAKACSEKLGFDTEGLKNPELVGLTVETLADLSKIQKVLSPSEFVACNQHLQSNGIGMKEFSDYLHNRSVDLTTDEKVQSALVDAMKEITPNISEAAINQKLYGMYIED